MSYAAVAEKLKSVPETDMQEVSDFLDFILFRNEEKTTEKIGSRYPDGWADLFGSVKDETFSVKSEPRKGWAQAFFEMHKNHDDVLEFAPESEEFEWEWQ